MIEQSRYVQILSMPVGSTTGLIQQVVYSSTQQVRRLSQFILVSRLVALMQGTSKQLGCSTLVLAGNLYTSCGIESNKKNYSITGITCWLQVDTASDSLAISIIQQTCCETDRSCLSASQPQMVTLQVIRHEPGNRKPGIGERTGR